MIPAWVIVTGDFTPLGGQDKANYGLARYLAERGDTEVHLVAHRVEERLAQQKRVTVHRVRRPWGSHFLGQGSLNRTGQAVARTVLARHPSARVIVNGGNCRMPDIGWVHMVHHAYRGRDAGAPFAFRLKNRYVRWLGRKEERRVLSRSRLLIANSERTRRDLIEHLGISASVIHTVYLGCDPLKYGPVSAMERRAARQAQGLSDGVLAVVFSGALGYDQNKGFDTLLKAWQELHRSLDSPAMLLAAGGGCLPFWQDRIDALGLASSVRLLGLTERIPELLAAADLLVSPTRYDAYGLAVHEALCRGVPAIVSACAGVAERYPPELSRLRLNDPEDAAELATRIRDWHGQRESYQQQVENLGAMLRLYTWNDMAAKIVSLVESTA